MADLEEVQALNAERIVSQFFAVRMALGKSVDHADLDSIAATLTGTLFSSDAGAKACGITDGKTKHLVPPRP
jgi:hypothetical protein